MRSCQIYCITKESDIGRMRHLNSHVSGIMTFGYLWAIIWKVKCKPCLHNLDHQHYNIQFWVRYKKALLFFMHTSTHDKLLFRSCHHTQTYILIAYLIDICRFGPWGLWKSCGPKMAILIGKININQWFMGSVCSNTFCAAVASQEPLAAASLVPCSFWFPEHLRTKRTQWKAHEGWP